MHSFTRFLCGSAALLTLALNSQAEQTRATDLENLMTPAQFEAAGLHKLSGPERESLYRWLQDYIDGNPTSAASYAQQESNTPENAENFGFPAPPPDQLEGEEAVHATVLPPFKGWEGKTVFKLDNGQVWQQRRSGRFTYRGEDARVVITRNSWGFYDMRLIEADRSVGVKRIR